MTSLRTSWLALKGGFNGPGKDPPPVEGILAKYKTAGGFGIYDRLSGDDCKALAGPATARAEHLSKLRGTLGPN